MEDVHVPKIDHWHFGTNLPMFDYESLSGMHGQMQYFEDSAEGIYFVFFIADKGTMYLLEKGELDEDTSY